VGIIIKEKASPPNPLSYREGSAGYNLLGNYKILAPNKFI